MSITVNVGWILLPLSSTCSELRGATSTWENSWDTYTVGETIIGLSSQNSEVDARKERGSISLLIHNIDPVSIYNYYIIFNITHKLVIVVCTSTCMRICIHSYVRIPQSHHNIATVRDKLALTAAFSGTQVKNVAFWLKILPTHALYPLQLSITDIQWASCDL